MLGVGHVQLGLVTTQHVKLRICKKPELKKPFIANSIKYNVDSYQSLVLQAWALL